MFDQTARQRLPNAPGVGYKPQHFNALVNSPGPVEWLEIHAENYMGDGGRPHAQLHFLREKFDLSIHGVGLSIGGHLPLDDEHLSRLKRLCDQYQPQSFSEHLAWSSHTDMFYNDLLPLPYTDETLAHVCDHINQVQDVLNRQMLLENPSSYLSFAQSTWSEPAFLEEIAQRTGCGLLLDVNNVFVSATNLDYAPRDYLAEYPLASVGEIHLGGHAEDSDQHGARLLIDDHASAVTPSVWHLLAEVLTRTGPKPILIEWDNDVPDWPALRDEASQAALALGACVT